VHTNILGRARAAPLGAQEEGGDRAASFPYLRRSAVLAGLRSSARLGRLLRAAVPTLGRLGHVLTAVHPAVAVTVRAAAGLLSLALLLATLHPLMLTVLHALMLRVIRAGLSARLRLAHLMLGMGVRGRGGRGGRRGLGERRGCDRKRERDSDDLHETCSV